MFFACLSHHLIWNVQSHFEFRHPRTHTRIHYTCSIWYTRHTLIICTPNLRLQSNIPRWIIAIITKKWFGFSANPNEIHVLNFANAFLSIGVAHNLHMYQVNIRSFRMLSHKWICSLEAVALILNYRACTLYTGVCVCIVKAYERKQPILICLSYSVVYRARVSLSMTSRLSHFHMFQMRCLYFFCSALVHNWFEFDAVSTFFLPL